MPRWYRHSNNWGGKRTGAGRPVQDSPTQRLSITLPKDLIRTVEQEAHYRSVSRSAVIAQYLCQAIHAKQKATDQAT